MKQQQLIFVYNANSDLFSTINDFVHKIISPSTYNCHLCSVTHGNFSEKNEWKTFVENFPVKTIFLYKDEFIKRYKIDTALPVIFVQNNGKVLEIISRKEIEACASISELKDLVTTKYNDYVQHHNTHL